MKTLVAGLAVVVMFVGAVEAATLHVPGEYAKIEEAMGVASDGDTIIVAPGVHTRLIDYLDPGHIAFWKNVTVTSTDPCDPCVVAATIIDAQGSEENLRQGVVFYSVGRDAVLAGVTITGGAAGTMGMSPGAAIACIESSPTISRCVIRDNGIYFAGMFEYSYGGGIHCGENSSPLITDCIIKDNTCGMGGAAVDCVGGGSPAIVDCIIEGNYSGWGAGGVEGSSASLAMTDCIVRGNRGTGIICQGSDTTISRCTIADNTYASAGGGVYCRDGSPTIEHCIIRGNQARSWDGGGSMAGGITCYNSSPNISNCIIAGNRADGSNDGGVWNAGYGGGVKSIANSNPTITNCVLWGNMADDEGGGVYGGAIMKDSILWGNSPDQIGSVGSPVVSYSDIQGSWPGVGNIADDPCFVDAVGGDYHLRLDSLCIDAGDPCTAAGGVDIDGFARVADGDGDGSAVVDMGADEVGVIGSWHSATQCHGDGDGDGDVDTVDWPAFRDAFGWAYPYASYDVRGDLDRDADVDTADWPSFRDHFGWPVPADCVYDGVWPPVD